MACPSFASDSGTSTTTTPGASPSIPGRHKRRVGQTHRVRGARSVRHLALDGNVSEHVDSTPSEASRRRHTKPTRSLSRSSSAMRSTNKSKSREHVVLDLTRENIARFYMAPKNELKFIGRGDKDAKSNKAHKQASKERPELLNFAMGRLFEDLDTMYTPGSLDHLLPRRR